MAKTTAIIFGVIFLIAGVWGLFASPVIGFIAADTLSSIIHIVVGVVLLVLASKPSVGAALKTVGIIYVILGILGLVGASFIANSSGTAWFYLVVGVIVAILGFKKSGSSMGAPMSSAPQM